MSRFSFAELNDGMRVTRKKFEDSVRAACTEVIEMSKEVASTIGEISVAEAKRAIIQEFTLRLG